MNGRGLGYWWLKWSAMAWLVIGRNKPALDIFEQMLRRWPNDGYALSSRSHIRAQAGERDAAIGDMQALVAAQPDGSAAYWFNLAFLLGEANRHAEAEPAFRRALALDPKLDRAWYGLGLTLIHLQRPIEAIAALKKNTELQPMSPYGWYQLARVQFDRQEPEETKKIIRHLKGFEPKVAAQLERETGLVG
jgi:tetratricopeptide (TPR) repeat protein